MANNNSMPLEGTPAAIQMAKVRAAREAGESPQYTSKVARNHQGDPDPRTIYDIQLLLKDLINPSIRSSPGCSVSISGYDESGKKVSITTQERGLSTDAQVLDLFKGLQIKMQMANKLGETGRRLIYQAPPALLDNLLARRYGACRDGLRMYWNLPDGTYFFCPFTKKITRKKT